ncbi:hypothetical protein V6N13_099308 [Hibiscus sabdariffa]|uniref:Uncharacterized protein n=1 Tax=Hibiscus sabdariffa TaxID=183260 RepID=A0ABR2PZS0_9ROSI
MFSNHCCTSGLLWFCASIHHAVSHDIAKAVYKRFSEVGFKGRLIPCIEKPWLQEFADPTLEKTDSESKV